jgi:sugar phosphate isomerase/epimerase
MANGNHLPILQKLADIGYKGVEGYGYGMTPAEFRKVVEDMGMVVSSYFGPTPTPETVQEFIDTAGELGTSLTVSGFWIPEFETVDAIRATADRLNAVLPTLHAAGLTFALHNHWMEFEQREGRLAIEHLLEFCPDLDLELDVYWCSAFGANDPAEMMARFADKVPLMHMKDGPFVKGEPHVAVGSGKLDVGAVMKARNRDVLKWVVVELDECATDMVQAVEDSYRYLVGNGYAGGNR